MLWDETEEVPEDEYTIPLVKANIISSGSDLTIVAYGYQVRQAGKVIESLPNYSIELIDLQTLDPLDMDTILASVSKTGKLLLIQEDYQKCSLSEHIAYNVYKSVSLKSKTEIISSKYAPVTFSPPLEEDLLPQVCDITGKVKEILG